MADPVQSRAKEKRLAEALRANLKRRKEQARERATDKPANDADESSTGNDPKRPGRT